MNKSNKVMDISYLSRLIIVVFRPRGADPTGSCGAPTSRTSKFGNPTDILLINRYHYKILFFKPHSFRCEKPHPAHDPR